MSCTHRSLKATGDSELQLSAAPTPQWVVFNIRTDDGISLGYIDVTCAEIYSRDISGYIYQSVAKMVKVAKVVGVGS